MWWFIVALLLLLAALLLESGLLAYAMYVLLGLLLLMNVRSGTEPDWHRREYAAWRRGVVLVDVARLRLGSWWYCPALGRDRTDV